MATWVTFEDIEAWQLARAFCQDIYLLIKETELAKDFRLKDQINGSSGSTMDNIAEGYERGGNREFIQFLSIAKASIGESRSQLYRIFDRGYIDENSFKDLSNKTRIISMKISKLIGYLKSSSYKGVKYK